MFVQQVVMSEYHEPQVPALVFSPATARRFTDVEELYFDCLACAFGPKIPIPNSIVQFIVIAVCRHTFSYRAVLVKNQFKMLPLKPLLSSYSFDNVWEISPCKFHGLPTIFMCL